MWSGMFDCWTSTRRAYHFRAFGSRLPCAATAFPSFEGNCDKKKKKKVTVSQIIISRSLEFRSIDLSPNTDNVTILDKYWISFGPTLAFVRIKKLYDIDYY